MESLGPKCTPLKQRYEECFNAWYAEKFLKGDLSETEPCRDLFEEYKACLVVRSLYHPRD